MSAGVQAVRKGTGGPKILHLLTDHAGLFDRLADGLKSARPCGLGRDQADMADDGHTLNGQRLNGLGAIPTIDRLRACHHSHHRIAQRFG